MSGTSGTAGFQGASDIGQPEPGLTDALSVLQRIRDGLLALPADSSDEKGAAA